MSSVLVATWGSPWERYSREERRYEGFRWEEVKYVFNDLNVKSRSSLRILLDSINPSKTVIIVLDTVAVEPASKYSELVENVKSMYYEFMENELNVDAKSIDVVVAPGVGNFPNGKFAGYITDYYSYTLYVLAQILNADESGKLHVHLDLTHGINFMPTLTYRVLRELTGILALTGDIRFTVYNTDPYSREARELHIHEVEDVIVPPTPCRKTARWDKLRPLKYVSSSPEEARRLDHHVKHYCGSLNPKELNAFLGSIVNGLPLALYTFYPNVKNMKKCIDTAIELFKDNTKISLENGKLSVKRNAAFTNDFNVLVKAYIEAENIGFSRTLEASLLELHNVKEKVFSKNDKLKAMIGRDLHEIKKNAEKVVESGKISEYRNWTSLSKLIGEEEEFKSGTFIRNFLAHSGLERSVTEVKLVCGEDLGKCMLLRYRGDMLNEIVKASIKGLIIDHKQR